MHTVSFIIILLSISQWVSASSVTVGQSFCIDMDIHQFQKHALDYENYSRIDNLTKLNSIRKLIVFDMITSSPIGKVSPKNSSVLYVFKPIGVSKKSLFPKLHVNCVSKLTDRFRETCLMDHELPSKGVKNLKLYVLAKKGSSDCNQDYPLLFKYRLIFQTDPKHLSLINREILGPASFIGSAATFLKIDNRLLSRYFKFFFRSWVGMITHRDFVTL